MYSGFEKVGNFRHGDKVACREFRLRDEGGDTAVWSARRSGTPVQLEISLLKDFHHELVAIMLLEIAHNQLELFRWGHRR